MTVNQSIQSHYSEAAGGRSRGWPFDIDRPFRCGRAGVDQSSTSTLLSASAWSNVQRPSTTQRPHLARRAPFLLPPAPPLHPIPTQCPCVACVCLHYRPKCIHGSARSNGPGLLRSRSSRSNGLKPPPRTCIICVHIADSSSPASTLLTDPIHVHTQRKRHARQSRTEGGHGLVQRGHFAGRVAAAG